MEMDWKDKPVKYLRDKTVEQLKYSFTNQHLEINEFEQMVKTALATNSKAELIALTADLPQKSQGKEVSRDYELALYEEQRTITCIMSESKTNGIWSPSKQVKLVCVMGDAEVDFRDVHLKADITYVQVTCVMGNTTIVVPPDVNVICNVQTIMAGLNNRSRGKIDYTKPTIMVEGRIVMGNMEIIEDQ